MSLGLSKDLDPVLTCHKCKLVVENYSNAYLVWNELDRLDDEVCTLDTILMHEECINEMLLEFDYSESEELKTISIANYIVNLVKRNSIDASIFIIDEHLGGNNIGQ